MIFGWSLLTQLMFLVALPSSLLSMGAILQKTGGWAFLPNSDNSTVRTIILLPNGLFMLGFFTTHFLSFHFVQGFFLNSFFPLINDNPLRKTVNGMILLFKDLVARAFRSFWPVILVSALSRLKSYKIAFQKTGVLAMFHPYVNVIRMHLMIFIIAFLWSARLSSAVLYLALFLYFFPIGSFLDLGSSYRKGACDSR